MPPVVSLSVPALKNRQILLRRRPIGLVQPDDAELVITPAPELAEGEALLRTTYVGLDAAALGSNLLVKTVLAFTAGGRRFGTGFLAAMAAPAVVFGVAISLAVIRG